MCVWVRAALLSALICPCRILLRKIKFGRNRLHVYSSLGLGHAWSVPSPSGAAEGRAGHMSDLGSRVPRPCHTHFDMAGPPSYLTKTVPPTLLPPRRLRTWWRHRSNSPPDPPACLPFTAGFLWAGSLVFLSPVGTHTHLTRLLGFGRHTSQPSVANGVRMRGPESPVIHARSQLKVKPNASSVADAD